MLPPEVSGANSIWTPNTPQTQGTKQKENTLTQVFQVGRMTHAKANMNTQLCLLLVINATKEKP